MTNIDERLTREQVATIIKMLNLTTDREFDCDECLQHVSEYAESNLAGWPQDEAIARVEQHLALCYECREEFELLMKILKAGQ